MSGYRVTETGRRTIAVRSYRAAQIACARRIASDASGRTLTIEGPNGVTTATNNGLTIHYEGAQR